ncbi:MAG: hypothetical protein EXR36_14165 [Betaproteobacteria bacterium]|nr:hypothetical protein [Betaproteobacteria bacterium]
MVYARLLRGTDPGAKRSLESDQRKWWGERSQCQKNADPPACVEQSYTTRIGNLKARPDYPGDVAPAMGPKIIQDAPIKEAGQGWAKNLSEYFKAINLCVASARTPIQAVLSAWNEGRDMVAMWLRRQDGQNLRCTAARNGNQLKSLVDWDVGEDIHTTGPVLYLGAKEPGCASAAGVIDPIGTPLGWLIGTDCLSQEAKNAEPS